MVGTFITGALMVVAGCQNDDGAQDAVMALGANTMGISQLEIHHSSQHGAQQIDLRGLDESGAEIVTVTLVTPAVGSTEAATLAFRAGTEVSVQKGPFGVHPALEPLQPELASFSRLSEVAAALDAEGVRVHRWDNAGERTYTAASCTGSMFPTKLRGNVSAGHVAQCCIDGPYNFFKIGQGNDAGKLGLRLKSPSGLGCRRSDGYTACDGSITDQNNAAFCTYGSAGFQAIGAAYFGSTNDGSPGPAIFVPFGSYWMCGWDTDFGALQAPSNPNVTWNPEQLYTSAPQTGYGGVDPGFTSSACDANGNPTNVASPFGASESP